MIMLNWKYDFSYELFKYTYNAKGKLKLNTSNEFVKGE